jgi:hypothetical protein
MMRGGGRGREEGDYFDVVNTTRKVKRKREQNQVETIKVKQGKCRLPNQAQSHIHLPAASDRYKY